MGTCILVLGLHRGGTSCTAGVLWRLGIDMNPTSGITPGNTHEDKELQLLHEEAIGHWTTPVPDFERIRVRYTAAIREREHTPLWGYKDPRLNFLLPDVLDIIDCEVKIISVYRPMWCAAQSIVRANPGMALDEAHRITDAYHEARGNALRIASKQCDVYPLFYDDLVNRPQLQVATLAQFLDVEVEPEAINFIDPKLRHFK